MEVYKVGDDWFASLFRSGVAWPGLQGIALNLTNDPSTFDGISFRASSYVRLDNLTISYIPEPATMALLGIGGIGVLLRKRRRR